MTDSESSYSKEEQLKGLIEQLDAYINHYHGGSVKLKSFKDGVVKVKLGGACENCPMQSSTIHGWVEGTIRQFFPEIQAVEEAG